MLKRRPKVGATKTMHFLSAARGCRAGLRQRGAGMIRIAYRPPVTSTHNREARRDSRKRSVTNSRAITLNRYRSNGCELSVFELRNRDRNFQLSASRHLFRRDKCQTISIDHAAQQPGTPCTNMVYISLLERPPKLRRFRRNNCAQSSPSVSHQLLQLDAVHLHRAHRRP